MSAPGEPNGNEPGSGPAKYRLFQAVPDVVAAVRTNARAYVTVAAISFAVIILAAIVAGLGVAMLAPFIRGNGVALITIVLILLVVVTLIIAVAGALMQNTTSLALAAGADGKTTRVMETLRKGWSRILRVSAVNALVVAIAMGPLVGAYIALFVGTITGNSGLALLSTLLVLAGVIWSVMAILRYSLSSYVALFESEIPVTKTLLRSRELLKGGGQWFVVKAVLLAVAITIAVSMLTGTSPQQSSSNPLVNLVSLVLSFLLSGSFVMLYRNRRQARG